MLREANAVSDLSLRFFDTKGAQARPLDDRGVGIRLEQLKAVNRCVAVVGGTRKAEAIHAALRGGWINVLVTDRATAEILLRFANG